ncbi:MAG: alpha/beta hydrolase [Proteobacteria bacterium]|nr:alpha/beta hydrolase [Pseudomonadota bacterium]
MNGKYPVRVADLRGYSRLAIDATVGLTSLVETMHHNILRMPGVLGEATGEPTRGLTGLVYKSIRGVTRLVGSGIDLTLGRLQTLLGSETSTVEREAILAALNGVLGDYLSTSGNPLAISMRFRRGGKPLTLTRSALAAAIPDASHKVVLLAHGLCMNDLQWRRKGHDHGAALAADAGFTPVYLHYNSGLHISTNGRAFAERIEALLWVWPVRVNQVAILAHSMGGLVARSACHYGERAGHSWRRRLDTLICLGTPHLGAALERGGNWVDRILDASPYTTAFARLGKIRSAGITDLRHGNVIDEDWEHRDRFARSRQQRPVVPLPESVKCYAIAASIAKRRGKLADNLLGDGLVAIASALGQDPRGQRNLAFPTRRQWIGQGMNHMDLLDRGEVYAQIRRWLSEPQRQAT